MKKNSTIHITSHSGSCEGCQPPPRIFFLTFQTCEHEENDHHLVEHEPDESPEDTAIANVAEVLNFVLATCVQLYIFVTMLRCFFSYKHHSSIHSPIASDISCLLQLFLIKEINKFVF